MAKDQPKIWCSDVICDSKYTKSIDYALPPPPEPIQYDFWLRRYERGEFVAREEFPDKMVARQRYLSLPDIFKAANRVVVVRERVKEVLEQFRLGRSHLVEVPIWDADEREKYDGPFYILNIAEQRDVFLPDQTEAAYQNRTYGDGPPPPWRVRGSLEDDKLAVRAAPPEDVDLWMHPNLAEMFFLSAPLVQAIKAAKIRRFGLFSCQTVE